MNRKVSNMTLPDLPENPKPEPATAPDTEHSPDRTPDFTPSFTIDTFFNGRVKVRQHRTGYRFSIDAILLAAHVLPRPGDAIVDLGTGCGIIPVVLAFRHPDTRISGIEIQPDLAASARENIRANQMADRVRIMEKDMRHVTLSDFDSPQDIVISNPPYHRAHSGRINPTAEKAIARHEIKMTLNDLTQTASRLLRTMGKFITIYPAERLADLLSAMQRFKIEPKYIRPVQSTRTDDAKLVLVTGIRNGRPGLKFSAPLIIYQSGKTYTQEVAGMYAARLRVTPSGI